MSDATLIGTMRQTISIACYDNGRTPDDGLPPDRIVEEEFFFELDGRPIVDPARIAAIRAAQEAQSDGDR